MPNTGKTIKEFALLASLANDDAVLIQRGNTYYYTLTKSIASGAVVTSTYANANTAKSASTLERGATYYLTDKYIWLFALASDKFNLNGTYFARNADYQGAGVYAGITIANGFTVNATGTNLGIWTSALAPASGDVAIWNNLHWLNITGANGASNPSADAVNWEAVANTDTSVADTYGYIYEFDAIEYDFDGDSINRRVDLRGNDVSTSDGISNFQWGNDNVFRNNVVGQLKMMNLIVANAVNDNYIQGVFDTTNIDTSNSGDIQYNNIVTSLSNSVKLYSYGGSFSITYCNIQHLSATKSMELYDDLYSLSNRNFLGNQSIGTFSDIIPLVTTAYAGGTTYSFGNFMTSGTVTYMYINATPASGNPAPDATYWQPVFDFTTAGRHKLTISKYWYAIGELNLTSTNATETIDEIVWNDSLYSNTDNYAYIKLTSGSGLAVTYDNTAFASLANAGEIVAPANVVVDGDTNDFIEVQRQYNGQFITQVINSKENA
jgi:hypothetical protein